MATRKTLNISLTPKLGRFINQRVASGQYTSASEVVRESLRLLQERERTRRELAKKVEEGLNASRRGDMVDGETFFRQLLGSNRVKPIRRKAG